MTCCYLLSLTCCECYSLCSSRNCFYFSTTSSLKQGNRGCWCGMSLHGKEWPCSKKWLCVQKDCWKQVTYVFCTTAEDFLFNSLKDFVVREILMQHIGLQTSDYNFIECQPKGCCFNIQEKWFVTDPPDLVGSKRAYEKYVYHERMLHISHTICWRFVRLLYEIWNFHFHSYY